MANMKNILTRTLSGTLLVAGIMAATFWCRWSRDIMLMLIAVGCQWELLGLMGRKGAMRVAVCVVSALLMLSFSVWGASYEVAFAVVAMMLARFASELYTKSDNPVGGVAADVLSFAYTAVPAAVAMTLGSMPLALLFVMVWINDVGAFLVGSTMGRHKLFVRLSPSKTWEGCIGGVALTVAAGIVTARFVTGGHMWQWALVGLLTAIGAVLGDLFESMIKRSVGVKDSGNVIPGHGGMLDRFDALLFAAPLFCIAYNVIFKL